MGVQLPKTYRWRLKLFSTSTARLFLRRIRPSTYSVQGLRRSPMTQTSFPFGAIDHVSIRQQRRQALTIPACLRLRHRRLRGSRDRPGHDQGAYYSNKTTFVFLSAPMRQGHPMAPHRGPRGLRKESASKSTTCEWVGPGPRLAEERKCLTNPTRRGRHGYVTVAGIQTYGRHDSQLGSIETLQRSLPARIPVKKENQPGIPSGFRRSTTASACRACHMNGGSSGTRTSSGFRTC